MSARQTFSFILKALSSLCWLSPLLCSFIVWCNPICQLCFCFLWFGVLSRKSLPEPISRSLSPTFSPSRFRISGLPFPALIHHAFNLFGRRTRSQVSVFYMWISNRHSTIYRRGCPFSKDTFWCPHQGLVGFSYMASFLGSRFCCCAPCVCTLMLCFGSGLWLEIMYSDTSSLFFLLKISLAIWGLLCSQDCLG